MAYREDEGMCKMCKAREIDAGTIRVTVEYDDGSVGMYVISARYGLPDSVLVALEQYRVKPFVAKNAGGDVVID